MAGVKNFIKTYLPTPALVFIILATLSALVLAVANINPDFADFVNSTVSVVIRALLSYLTYLFPFSVFEILVLLAIPLFIVTLVLSLRGKPSAKRYIRGAANLLGLICLIFSLFVFTLGVGYKTTDLSSRLNLVEEESIEKEELYSVTVLVRDEVNRLSSEIDYTDGQSYSGYTLNEISKKLCDAYDIVFCEYPVGYNFESRVKPVKMSGVMSDAGITGIYSFFTGEANLNVAYPDYCLPFTMAHEMAHQRGFSRENEANFMAYLVCIHSDDNYIKYSGYLSLYKYLISDLYRASPELYKDVAKGLSDGAKADITASQTHALMHSGTKLGEISDKANNAYLQINGTEGVVSYGFVVRLAVAYHKFDVA
jgi:hypothetical protein